jgi:dUTP pyrophosphatase
MIGIFFKKLHPNATIPTWGHEDDKNAAIDIYSCLDKPLIIWPKCSKVISTGIAWYIDSDSFYRMNLFNQSSSERDFKIAMIVQSRSGLAFKKGLESTNAGVIDEGYTGEIKLKLYNNSWFPRIIRSSERIAQGVIEALPIIQIKEWLTDIPETKRGTKGFGSSGTN